jgi:beta-galactosidase
MKQPDPFKSTTQVTRRDFLKTTSAAVVAGAVVGRFLPEQKAIAAGNILATSESRILTGWEFRKGGLGGLWELWRKASDDTVTWQPAEVPHCFNADDAVDPDITYYQGHGWYRTRLKIENPFPNGRTLLHFEGAGQKTEVYVFTTKVGAHVGGYDEFTVDVTDAANAELKKAENKGLVPLAVKCDNGRDIEMIPSNLSDFNLYGGLYRYVNLRYVPTISLERIYINSRLDSNGKATVSVSGRLFNPANLNDRVRVAIQISDLNDKVLYTDSKDISPWIGMRELGKATIETPLLWSPQNPSLYKCVVTIESPHGQHRIKESFGLRSFEFVKNGPFKLNGERLLLRGTHRHEDHAGLGAALTEDLIRKEFALMKEMGVNFIRLGHYQQSRIALDLCDELGMLAWEEIPWCRGGLGGETYKDQVRRMLTNMIDQHRNHPSVIIWGLGNENDWPGDFAEFDKDKIRAFMIELNELSHNLDLSRKTAIRRCDFCKDIVDVYSPSIWAGWYGNGRYTEYRTRSETEMKKVNHFLHVEYGGDSQAGRHSEATDKVISQIADGKAPDERGIDYFLSGGVAKASSDGDWSETYICNLFDWHLKEQETMDWLAGAAQWVFKDFSTPLRPENPVPRVNQKGVVTRDLTIKEAYYVFQSYWAEKPMIHIYGHSWPVRWGEKDEPKMIKVYSNCPSVELFVNDVSLGEKKRSSQDFPAAGLRWQAKLKEGKNAVRAVWKNSGKTIVDEITQEYQTQKWEKPAKLILENGGGNGETFRVNARVADRNGIPCLDARQFVRFDVTGDAKLVDNLGTPSGARKVQLCNGRASIRVIVSGASAVCVSSDGLPTALLMLNDSLAKKEASAR